jgi:hypothetical protein
MSRPLVSSSFCKYRFGVAAALLACDALLVGSLFAALL